MRLYTDIRWKKKYRSFSQVGNEYMTPRGRHLCRVVIAIHHYHSLSHFPFKCRSLSLRRSDCHYDCHHNCAFSPIFTSTRRRCQKSHSGAKNIEWLWVDQMFFLLLYIGIEIFCGCRWARTHLDCGQSDSELSVIIGKVVQSRWHFWRYPTSWAISDFAIKVTD